MDTNKLTIEWNRTRSDVFKTARLTIPNDQIIPLLKRLELLDELGMKAKERTILAGAVADPAKNILTISVAAIELDSPPTGEVDTAKQRAAEASAAQKIEEQIQAFTSHKPSVDLNPVKNGIADIALVFNKAKASFGVALPKINSIADFDPDLKKEINNLFFIFKETLGKITTLKTLVGGIQS